MIIVNVRYSHYPIALPNKLPRQYYDESVNIYCEKNNWLIKACCDKIEIDSSSDFELKQITQPVSKILNRSLDCHLWNIKHNLHHA